MNPPNYPPSSAGRVSASEAGEEQQVYVLGNIGIDYGSEARKRLFEEAMGRSLYDPKGLLERLKEKEKEGLSLDLLTWTLCQNSTPRHDPDNPGLKRTVSQNSTPLYVLSPQGPFARLTLDRIKKAFMNQLSGTELVAIPGTIQGQSKLQSGAEVEVLEPNGLGILEVNTDDLLSDLVGPRPDGGNEQALWEQRMAMENNLLGRIFFEKQNPGKEPEDRAVNFALVHEWVNIQKERAEKSGEEFVLTRIEAHPKPSYLNKPGSDRWEVTMTFGKKNAAQRENEADQTHIVTIDVGPLIPRTEAKTSSF